MGPGEARKAKAAAEKKKREAGSGSWLDKNVGYGVHDIRRGLAKDCIHWYVEESCVSIIPHPVYSLYTPLLPYLYLYAPFIHVYTPYIHL